MKTVTRSAGFVFFAAVLFISTCFAANNGVPQVPIDFSQDVEVFWETHPFNPDGPNYNPDILSPTYTVTLNPGDSIHNAVANLPASGGTIILNPGTYSGSFDIMKSHVHILAPSGATVTGYFTILGCEEARDYGAYNLCFKQDNPDCIDCWNNPITDIYFNNITFDGGGSRTSLGICKVVNGVVWDDCTFTNTRDPRSGHPGVVNAHEGADNLWLRDCHIVGPTRFATYYDGTYGSGMINCRIESNFSAGGFLFLANEDFTKDFNENGTFEKEEKRNSQYCVIYGNTFAGGLYNCVSATANDFLLKNNTVESFTNNFAFFNPKTSLINFDMKHFCYGHRIVGNTTQGLNALVEMNFNLDYLPPGEDNKSRIGKYQVRGNKTGSCPLLVKHVGEVDGPNLVCGNCINDAGCTPNPDCHTADQNAPTIPSAPVLDNATDTSISFHWDTSTDDVGVTGYVIYRDGVYYDETDQTTYIDEDCVALTEYTYEVSAYDAAVNESAKSDPLIAQTDPPYPVTDRDGDGDTDYYDFRKMAVDYNTTGYSPGDTNFDDVVDFTDVVEMAKNWLNIELVNIIQNPSFEDGFNHWSGPSSSTGQGQGTLLEDAAISFDGSFCYNAIGSVEAAYIHQPFTGSTLYNLKPDTTYTMSVMVRLDNPGGGPGKQGGVMIRYPELVPTTVVHGSPWLTTDTGGDWVEISQEFTTTPSYVSGRLDILWDHTSGDIYIDDIKILVEAGDLE